MHIGRYEVVKALKGGGMGSVTLCRAPDGDLVVLKRPHSVDEEAAVRLRDEARIGARLLHPGIVDTLDLFEHEGRPVLVVAYVEGLSCEVLRGIGPVPVPVVARIGRQIADALDALHCADDDRGKPMHILHRDVTPGNILLGKDGDAKLIDLGIARFSERQAEHTQDGFLRGTMRYLAPELLEGGGYTAASDLWALGMVLWEAALGRFAYRGQTDREVLAGIVMGQPMEVYDGEEGVDPALQAAIAPLLTRLPVERTRSAAEAAARFAQIEDTYEDTVELSREALQDFIARKEPSIELPVLGVGAAPGRPDLGERRRDEGVIGAAGFEDVVTHVEPEEEEADGESESFDDEPTLAMPPPAAQSALSADRVGADRVDAARFGAIAGSDDPLEPQATAAVPAPIRFSTLSQGHMVEGAGDDFVGNADDEATLVDVGSPAVNAPAAAREDTPLGETAQRIAEVRDALLALASEEGDPIHPEIGGDDEETLSVSNPLPGEAFRSSIADRAAEFEEGVSLVTRAPAPQLDDDELEEMHTLDGLHPVHNDGAIEVTLRSPPPTPGPRSAATGLRKEKRNRRRDASPSWDAIAAVKAGSGSRSLVHVRTGVDDDDEITDTRPLAQMRVLQKTPEEVARDRANRPPPEPGVSNRPPHQRVDIDALPSARPRPRVETPEMDALSPFSVPTEVAPPPSQERPRVPSMEQEATTIDVGGPLLPMGEDADPAGDSAGELRMDTAVGAKITDLPAPSPPLRPLGPDVNTEPLFADGQPVDDDAADEPAPADDKRPAFADRETVSLNQIASLLDDD